MRYFYADSLDLVDPRFDFVAEVSPEGRQPQRDDVYAHQLFDPDRPYDGILVSKWLLHGNGAQGRYSQPQRQRFIREGAQSFLRFPRRGVVDPDRFPILGDCGAYNYKLDREPPFSVDSVVEFYAECGFTHGISVDHMMLDPKDARAKFDVRFDHGLLPVPAEFKRRFDLTLHLAEEFIATTRRARTPFVPLGVAQGWSPNSYRLAVRQLMRLGFDYIALGSMVPLKTPDIEAVLRAVCEETSGGTRLHLLGITRLESFETFTKAGVVSLDSTTPLRQGVKEGIYYGPGGPYLTIRIPQPAFHKELSGGIRSGTLRQEEVDRTERQCRSIMARYAKREATVDETLEILRSYADLFKGAADWSQIRRTLVERPWEKCPCSVCTTIGINVVIFRNQQTNRRRGFHNLWYTHRQLSALRSERIQEHREAT